MGKIIAWLPYTPAGGVVEGIWQAIAAGLWCARRRVFAPSECERKPHWQSIGRRTSSLSLAVAAGIASLWATAAMAQSHSIYVSPAFVYNEGDLDPPTPYETSLPAAWADVQTAFDSCNDGTCVNAQNLHPDTTGPYACSANHLMRARMIA